MRKATGFRFEEINVEVSHNVNRLIMCAKFLERIIKVGLKIFRIIMLSINDPTNNIRFLNKLYFNPYGLESFSGRCFNNIIVQVTTDVYSNTSRRQRCWNLFKFIVCLIRVKVK